MIIYAAGGKTPPPWISQASLAVDWAALNPSPDEIATLKKAGFQMIEVNASAFHKDAHVAKVTLLPFYWGFDVGMNVPADDVYQMLTIIDKHSKELAKLDPSLARYQKIWRPFRGRLSNRLGILLRSIQGSQNSCAKKECGTRSGIPRSDGPRAD